MILPNFLIIGAARSGTSTLYEWLKEHPQVYLPPSKRPEPHFFLKLGEYQKGLTYYSDKYFSHCHNEVAIGEASTSYLYQPHVAERIYSHLPHVKLIALLRHPVDRAYSNYWHTKKAGLEDLNFDQAIAAEQERIRHPFLYLPETFKCKNHDPGFWLEVQPYAYFDRGKYHGQLTKYLTLFPRRNIFVALFDDLQNQPKKLIQEIYGFLGVDQNFVPTNLNRIFNATEYIEPVMNSQIRVELLERYKSDNYLLSQLLGWDLTSWNV